MARRKAHRRTKHIAGATSMRIVGPNLKDGEVFVPWDNTGLAMVIAQGFATKAKSKAPVYLIYRDHVIGTPELVARVWRDEVDEVIYTRELSRTD